MDSTNRAMDTCKRLLPSYYVRAIYDRPTPSAEGSDGHVSLIIHMLKT